MRQSSTIFIIGIIALAAFVLLGMANSDRRVLSGWRGPAGAGEAWVANAAAAPANALVGVAQPQGRGLDAALVPSGNPLRAANTVITQGYGVGTHAPASVWGRLTSPLMVMATVKLIPKGRGTSRCMRLMPGA